MIFNPIVNLKFSYIAGKPKPTKKRKAEEEEEKPAKKKKKITSPEVCTQCVKYIFTGK